jgi:hypothetical protein
MPYAALQSVHVTVSEGTPHAIIIAVVGAVVGALITLSVPWLFGAARTGIPRLFGAVKLTYVRTALGGVFGLTAATAVALSTSDHSHKTVTYFVWYGLAALALAAVIALTLVIDRGSERKAIQPSRPRMPRFAPMNPPLSSQRRAAAAKALVEKGEEKGIDDPASIGAELRAWLEHERERGEEYRSQTRRQRERLAGEVSFLTEKPFGPTPESMLRRITQHAGEWSAKVKKRLNAEGVEQAAQRFTGGPPVAHPEPTQGDFDRLADYVQQRVDALKTILGESEND